MASALGAAVAGIAAILAVSACGSNSESEQTITGEGSTAQQKAMEHFTQVLTDQGGAVLDYTGSGSGDGIKKFLAGDADFAGSDSPLKPEEVTKARLGAPAMTPGTSRWSRGRSRSPTTSTAWRT